MEDIPQNFIRVLTFKQDSNEVIPKLQKLKEYDPKRFDTLVGICIRLVFKDKVRDLLIFDKSNDYGATFFLQHFGDQLLAYLTVTCIDVIAQDGENFKPYYDWLRLAILNSNVPIVNNFLSSLAQTTDDDETKNLLIGSLDPNSESANLTKVYLNEYGITRGFKRVLWDLDEWLKRWLAESFIVVPDDFFNPSVQDKWNDLDQQGRFRKICDYLYRLRNVFTHSVNPMPPLENRGTFITNFEERKYRFVSRFIEDDLELHIGLKFELRQSDVIQLIVVNYLRKHWLQIEDNESFIEVYWQDVEYHYRRTQFIEELNGNRNYVRSWYWGQIIGDLEEKGHLPSLSIDAFEKFYIKKIISIR